MGLVSYSPGPLALLRFLIASFCMGITYYFLPYSKVVSWSDRAKLVLLGGAGIGVYNISLNYGELSVSAGVASFVVGLMPVLTVIFSIIFLQERPKRQVYIGIVLSFAGLFIMAVAESGKFMLSHGVLIIFVAALMGALYTVLQKHFLLRYHPIVVTSWVIWGGTLALTYFLPTLLTEIKVANGIATGAVVYMGIFPAAVAYVAWGYVLNSMPASRAAMYLYAMPVLSTFLGFVLLQEEPSFVSLGGGILTLSGAVYATRYRQYQEKKITPSVT